MYNYFKNMVEENVNREFRLKNIDETRNYFTEEINRNILMSKNHKKVCDINGIRPTTTVCKLSLSHLDKLASLAK